MEYQKNITQKPIIKDALDTLGFGGSCHWCTEAIFQSLKGVSEVLQGWIASENQAAEFSEAVLIKFDASVISLATLIAVHLHTHSCTSNHSMRARYRSAVYTFNETQAVAARKVLKNLQAEFKQPIITTVLPFNDFKLNKSEQLNYYFTDPDKPFCRSYISPRLRLLMERFGKEIVSNVSDTPLE